MSAHLLEHGIVHSVSDPYATAMLVADGVVAWLGSDESADLLAGPEVERIDLEGTVLAPGFVAPLGTRADAAGALRRGVTVLTVLDGWGPPQGADAGGEPGRTPADRRAPGIDAPAGLATVVYRAAEAVDPAAAGVWLATDGVDPESLAALVVASTRVGEQVYLVPTRLDVDEDAAAAAQSAALAALRAAADELGVPALGQVRHRLLVGAPVPAQDRAFLAAIGASATVVPDAAGALRAPVAALLADAVPVSLGVTGETNPWAAVHAALSHPVEAERISARSAFTAATRTGLRALPDVPAARLDAAPRLNVSAPATFAVWRAAAVAVQSPDGRVAAWSTDTRAGTPLLPSLDDPADLPVLEHVWIRGERTPGD